MVFRKNAFMCTKKRRKNIKLINHDCEPILMVLYIMIAYLMLLAALSNAACMYNAFFKVFCLGLLTHSLFISSMIFHHTQCF